ncbi:hypothetical protein CMK14_28620 [Candidatus Poribacteria bacterium]|nr:hypothetical protein [Candidatus Poribacteria bacterium]
MRGQVRPLFFIVSIFVVGIVVNGCGDSGDKGGGTAINLVRGEAIVADSVLAINVSHDRPDGITNTFYSDSERIFLWIYWINVSGPHRVKVNWYSPEEGLDDSPYDQQELTFSSDFQQVTWFYINPGSGGFVPGEWFVEIFLDDDIFERSHVFIVK